MRGKERLESVHRQKKREIATQAKIVVAVEGVWDFLTQSFSCRTRHSILDVLIESTIRFVRQQPIAAYLRATF